MELFSKFLGYISNNNLFSSKDTLLIAVSGGVDSVVLCELCHRAGFHFLIAHCNFQLRGEESERDERFAQSLGKKYGTEVLVKRFDTKKYAEMNKVSIQDAARELRYGWFRGLVGEGNSQCPPDQLSRAGAIGNEVSSGNDLSAVDWQLQTADCLLTAHHLDDNIETIMMNFFKGTGISGLRGMLPVTGKIVRPLLFGRKEELLQFARDAQLDFVDDSSNLREKNSRNFMRLIVLQTI